MVVEDEGGPTLAEILAAEAAIAGKDRTEDWPTISAAALTLLQIGDCEEQLGRASTQPLRLVQAAKSAHSALHAALTAALAGSMGIGAYSQELERKWREFLQEGTGGPPNERHVMHFKDLLRKAQSQPLEWPGRPLILESGDEQALEKLTAIRDGVEHPKPGFWVIEPEWLYRIIPVGPRLALQLLRGFAHQLEPGELDTAAAAVGRIEEACRRNES